MQTATIIQRSFLVNNQKNNNSLTGGENFSMCLWLFLIFGFILNASLHNCTIISKSDFSHDLILMDETEESESSDSFVGIEEFEQMTSLPATVLDDDYDGHPTIFPRQRSSPAQASRIVLRSDDDKSSDKENFSGEKSLDSLDEEDSESSSDDQPMKIFCVSATVGDSAIERRWIQRYGLLPNKLRSGCFIASNTILSVTVCAGLISILSGSSNHCGDPKGRLEMCYPEGL